MTMQYDSKTVGAVQWFEYDQETKKLLVLVEITDKNFKSRVLHTNEWEDILTIKGKDVMHIASNKDA